MRKVLCILLAVCLLALCGCAKAPVGTAVFSNDQYTIMESNGEFFLDFKVDVSKESGQQNGAVILPITFEYASIGQMKNAIQNGTFTTAQLAQMQGFTKSSNGNVAICNVNALWDVKLPQNLSVGKLFWFGISYKYWLYVDGKDNGELNVCSKADYDRYVDRVMPKETDELKFLSTETELERNATVTHYEHTRLGEEGKYIVYTYTDNGMKVTILEKYYYEYSKTAPRYLYGFGEGNGAYYYWLLGSFTERPSLEWIKSIGITPYVETEAS